MEEYAQEDEELRDKFRELRCGLKANSPITSTVHEFERYRRECTYLQTEIERMRQLLLNGNQAGWANYDRFEDRKTRMGIGAVEKDFNLLCKAVPKFEMVPVEVARGQL